MNSRIPEFLNRKIDKEAWEIGEALLAGILLEVSSYPKPGLVSSVSMGSHRDMNILTFMVSSAAIGPAYVHCAQAGRDHEGDLDTLLPSLRKIGVWYENRLLQSTKGVNTQRGILFAGGVLCGATGWLSRRSKEYRTDDICAAVSSLTRGISGRELHSLTDKNKERLTAGEELYLKYQARGIRGEVEEGFPSVRKAGLPSFYQAAASGLSLNHCLVHTLISLMSCVEDTTILWRKGNTELTAVQNKAREILELGSVFTDEGLRAICQADQEFINKNISPGGSADLVAVTAGLYLLIEQEFPVAIL